jgi:hypothetical protein
LELEHDDPSTCRWMEHDAKVLWEEQRFGFFYFVIPAVEHDAMVELQLHKAPCLESFGFAIPAVECDMMEESLEHKSSRRWYSR